MTDIVQKARERRRASRPWPDDVAGVGAAVVCAMVTWLCTAHLADLELTVQRGSTVQHIGGTAVAIAAGVSATVGMVVLRLLERLTARGLQIWTALAVVATVVSLLGPLSATSTTATGALASLHTVVAAVVIASAHASRRQGREDLA
jgi:hypothetical protein